VRVTSVAFDNEAPLADEGRSRLAPAQGALENCAGLVQRPGRVAIGFTSRDGAARDVVIVVDGVRDDAVTTCLTRAIAGVPLDRAGKGTATIAVE
jgi:hypothetical protein